MSGDLPVVIIYKPDGTVQCDARAPAPLQDHAAELLHIGATKICASANVAGPAPVITLCGAPTGRVNSFAIPKQDWEEIAGGIVGTLGFRLWTGAPYPDLEMHAGCRLSEDPMIARPNPSSTAMPVLIRELIGRPCRCYRHGEGLSLDFVPHRVNVERDEEGRIADIWFG